MKFNQMTFLIIFIACLIGIFFGVWFLLKRPNPALPASSVSIGGKVFTTEVADTMLSRTRGLSGRDSLPDGGGMLFVFPTSTGSGFWMKDMKFPIDIVWIRGEKVVGFAENMQPEPGKTMWSLKIYYPPEYVDMVLEINAGAVKKYGLRVGDMVNIR